MKRYWWVLCLCMSVALGVRAQASTREAPLYREMEYTLCVNNQDYSGVTLVSQLPSEEICALTAKGFVGSRQDAQAVFERFSVPARQLETFFVPQEYTYTYYSGESQVTFAPATFWFDLDHALTSKYEYAGAIVWLEPIFLFPEKLTAVYPDGVVDPKQIPELASTDFPQRIEEVYQVLQSLGVQTGDIRMLGYWDAQQLQRNIDENKGAPVPVDPSPWQQEDACISIFIPLYQQGIQLKTFSAGTTPDSLYDYRSFARALITEQAVVFIEAFGIFDSLEPAAQAPVLTPEEVLARYEEYLNQLLFMPDGADQLHCIRLEYNAWNSVQRGVFYPDCHLEPVWCVYTQANHAQPIIAFDAFTGEETLQ